MRFAAFGRSLLASVCNVAIGFQRATGIDSFNGLGDKDGYRNLSGRLRATWRPAPKVEVGASGIALTGRSEFDGFDQVTFAHSDTLDSSRNRLTAGRAWASAGDDATPWKGELAATFLSSSNRNYLADVLQNRTQGTRRDFSTQVERRFATGAIAGFRLSVIVRVHFACAQSAPDGPPVP